MRFFLRLASSSILAMGASLFACHASTPMSVDTSATDAAPPIACPPVLAMLPTGAGGGRYFTVQGGKVIDAFTQALIIDVSADVGASDGAPVSIDAVQID